MTTTRDRTRLPKTGALSNKRQVSLLHIFRTAAESGDARQDRQVYQDGDRQLTLRSQQARATADEGTLRRHLSIDLANLMNTIRLDAVIDLSDASYVERSVVNYGFRDMSSLTQSQETTSKIVESIRHTLTMYEPRLIPETIEIVLSEGGEQSDQRLSFEVTAEMIADPVDIPLDFVAEVDLGAGKMKMTQLRVQQ